MVSKTVTGYREALHRLRCVHLSAKRSQATADWGNNSRQKGRINRVCGHVTVYCSDERRSRIVHWIIVRVETEGNVIGNPEDSVAAANHSLLIVAVGKTDAGRHLRPIERNVGPVVWTDQKHIAAQPRQT